MPVPETSYSFGALITAQGRGDYQALMKSGQRVVRVRLGQNVSGGLRQLSEYLVH